MNSRNAWFVAAAALVVMLTMLVAPPSGAATQIVNVMNYTFTPPAVTVAQGDTVKWVWQAGFHTTTSGPPCTADGTWTAPLDSAHPNFSFVFNTPGAFPYFCSFHCVMNMTGSVTVNQGTDGIAPRNGLGASPGSLAAEPNPFHSPTTINFSLSSSGRVKLSVYDSAGRLVRNLAQGSFGAGPHHVRWDGRTDSGTELPGGIYFVRVWTPQGEDHLTLIKVQ